MRIRFTILQTTYKIDLYYKYIHCICNITNGWKSAQDWASYADINCGQTSCLDRHAWGGAAYPDQHGGSLMHHSNEQQRPSWYLRAYICDVGSWSAIVDIVLSLTNSFFDHVQVVILVLLFSCVVCCVWSMLYLLPFLAILRESNKRSNQDQKQKQKNVKWSVAVGYSGKGNQSLRIDCSRWAAGLYESGLPPFWRPGSQHTRETFPSDS